MAGGPRRQGGAFDQLPFSDAGLTVERLNVQCRLKRNDQIKILATRMRKGPPSYVGMPPPEWLIRP